MIKVFRCPKGQYRALYSRIMESGWLLLSVRRHEIEGDWLLRCVDKAWFCKLPYERQVWIAQGRRGDGVVI